MLWATGPIPCQGDEQGDQSPGIRPSSPPPAPNCHLLGSLTFLETQLPRAPYRSHPDTHAPSPGVAARELDRRSVQPTSSHSSTPLPTSDLIPPPSFPSSAPSQPPRLPPSSPYSHVYLLCRHPSISSALFPRQPFPHCLRLNTSSKHGWNMRRVPGAARAPPYVLSQCSWWPSSGAQA